MTFELSIRTPHGLLYEGDAGSLVAEDLDGWFGIQPSRSELVAVLPPGLLLARDAEGELFVALEAGLLHKIGRDCRVVARDATLTRDLQEIESRVEQLSSQRAERRTFQSGVLFDLAREALRRLALEVRQ